MATERTIACATEHEPGEGALSILGNQMLQIALGKQQHNLEAKWEEKEQQEVRELRQHLQHTHELAMLQMQQERSAELQVANVERGSTATRARNSIARGTVPAGDATEVCRVASAVGTSWTTTATRKRRT